MDGIDREVLKKIRKIVSPYYFGATKWTIVSLAGILGNMLKLKKKKLPKEEKQNFIEDYFSAGSKDCQDINNDQIIESIFKNFIREILRKEGFCLKSFDQPVLPPPCFKLTNPPAIIIVSPRDKLECSYSCLLKSDLSMEAIKKIESQVDSIGVSSWIGEIGGLSLFPILVSNHSRNSYAILSIVLHEWVHHFLFLRTRIGFFYLLTFFLPRQILRWIKINPSEVQLINEGLADFMSQELAKKISLNFPEFMGGQVNNNKGKNRRFHRKLGVIKQKVEEYLSSGRIDEAENFMKEMTKTILQDDGYPRKLNQASLSFLGNYDEANPLMPKFKEIRGKCSSLKEFLKKVSKVRSVKDLEKTN